LFDSLLSGEFNRRHDVLPFRRSMTPRPIPARHWRSYGTDPLPTGAEALDEPFSAFPSWFLRITCDRRGKDRMVNESHTPWRDRAHPQAHAP
jgi:hypothetical protein